MGCAFKESVRYGKVNQLHSIISNRDINSNARRLLLLSVIIRSTEYGSEVWEGNKGHIYLHMFTCSYAPDSGSCYK